MKPSQELIVAAVVAAVAVTVVDVVVAAVVVVTAVAAAVIAITIVTSANPAGNTKWQEQQAGAGTALVPAPATCSAYLCIGVIFKLSFSPALITSITYS